MNTRLFIGNLNFYTQKKDILPLIESLGTVIELEIVVDPYTLRSKGFAHLTVSSEIDAEKIIRKLHGQILKDRPIRIERFRD